MPDKTWNNCKCMYCGQGFSFTGYCKQKFCSDMCNAKYQEKSK